MTAKPRLGPPYTNPSSSSGASWLLDLQGKTATSSTLCQQVGPPVVFFKSFWRTHWTFFWGPLVPLFWISWWRLFWVSKPEWVLPYVAIFAEANDNVHSPRFTSGATLANLLAAGAQPVTSPHACAEVGLGSDSNVQPHEHEDFNAATIVPATRLWTTSVIWYHCKKKIPVWQM